MDPQILREAMTAYEAVYNEDLRVELEEKQVFENWVNSLVEEGYDLSEYSWEEMYDIFVNEDIKSFADRGGLLGAATRAISRSGTEQGKAQNRAAVGRFFSGINQGASKLMQTGGVLGRGGVADRMAGKVAAKPTAKPTAQQTGMSGRYAAPSAQVKTPAAKPAATTPVAKPAPTATAKPAPTATAKPAPTATATPSTPAAPKKTFNPLMQKTFGYQTGYAPDQVKGDIKKMAQTGSLKSISSGFDMFDVVKGHLIDEGYADTEEAALAIMANMSEEWRESIVIEAVKGESSERRKALAAERRAGVKPLPAKEGEKYASHKLSQMAYAKRRRMGEAFNIFVNTMISEGISLDRYSWDEIENVFDDLFEAQRARENPEEYERGEGRKDRGGQSREQQLRGRVMDRMSQMDPEKRKKMLAQMRAVGLDV